MRRAVYYLRFVSPKGDETKGVGLGVGLDLETRLGTERRREIDQVDLLEGRPL